MTSPEERWENLTSRFPALRNPNSWGELSESEQDRLANVIAEEAPDLVTDEDRQLGRSVYAKLQSAWSARFLRLFRMASAACIVPPPLFIPADWSGKHLVLYAIASAYTFLIAGGLLAKRAFGSAIAAALLGLFALVDCIAWLRIYPDVGPLDFPAQLAVLDMLAYFSIVISAAGLMRRPKERLDAPPSPWVYVFFTIYCYIACIYWLLLSTTLKNSPIASTLRRVWDLDATAVSFGFSEVGGLQFMTWLVWALYGISGTVSVILMLRRDSLRATIRWLLVPCSLYACMGPWIAESWQWFRYVFLMLPLLALADWLRSRSRRKG